MLPSTRISLIANIRRTLEQKYAPEEIDFYLSEYNIPWRDGTLTQALQPVAPEVLMRIADELEIHLSTYPRSLPPTLWQDTKQFRLFISHLAKDKGNAIRLKDCLQPYAISAFVAHEDIVPTFEWQREIERALHVMDAFLAIHTKGFKDSFWTQQEIGFAVARSVKMISLKMEDEDPTGFISKHQALPRKNRTAEQIATEVDTMLTADELTAEKMRDAKKVLQTASPRPRDSA
jgi:hypothetical protein